MSVVEIAPVMKSVEVRRSTSDAFRIFVHEATKWWPLDKHAIGPYVGTKAIEHVVEPRVGGRVYEVTEDGRTFDWGEVLAYEPGNRFAMTWQLGEPRAQSGEIEVRFERLNDTSCRVTLTHSGWERVPEKAQEQRDGYDNGWVTVFEDRFVAFANGGT